MIEQLTPKYKFTCDRCGKETYFDGEVQKFVVEFLNIEFPLLLAPTRIKGEVCYHCCKDFYELAGNFFNEVNKEREEVE